MNASARARARETPPPPERRLRRATVATAFAIALAACTPAPRPSAPSADQPPAGFPEAAYLQAAHRGEPVFRIVPAQSLVVVEVRRGGRLGHLGHDHVVSTDDLQGYLNPVAGRADLYLRLDRLVVDDPALRAAAGFTTQPSPAAIAGTRTNMLEKTLRAHEHPYAWIAVSGLIPADANWRGEVALEVAITLHGRTHRQTVPAEVDAGAGRIAAQGALGLRQTDFGIEPMSILGGAIRVEDALTLRFRLVAERLR
jgi:hypothetical protein